MEDAGLYHTIAFALDDIVFKDCADPNLMPEADNPYLEARKDIDLILSAYQYTSELDMIDMLE